MFAPIEAVEVFRSQHGGTSGAMGVDKVKKVDGKAVHSLRFISILTPTNAYTRKMAGDSWLLPQISQPGGVILHDGEWAWVNGEDLMPCSNLFKLPAKWKEAYGF